MARKFYGFKCGVSRGWSALDVSNGSAAGRGVASRDWVSINKRFGVQVNGLHDFLQGSKYKIADITTVL